MKKNALNTHSLCIRFARLCTLIIIKEKKEKKLKTNFKQQKIELIDIPDAFIHSEFQFFFGKKKPEKNRSKQNIFFGNFPGKNFFGKYSLDVN